MKQKYKISDNKRKFFQNQERLADLNNELIQTDNVEKELLQSINSKDEKLLDENTKSIVRQSINEALKKNNNQKNVLVKEVDNVANEIKNIKENVLNMLEDSKKQSESLCKKSLLRKFEAIGKGIEEIDSNILELSSLENSIKEEEINIKKIIANNNLEKDIFVSIPDKEDISWEVEKLLDDKKVRLEGFEEVCSGTQEIFEINITPKVNPLEYAQATGDAFTTAVNVITISSALIGEAISRRVKGDKK